MTKSECRFATSPYNTSAVKCPLCGQRKARRRCPALGHDICAVCCGTKRLVEIRCPADCPYLVSAREHPPAASVRQQQLDMALLVEIMRGFNERQSQLFLMAAAFLLRYQPAELQPLIDEDVAGAAGALAATFETSSRGLIYEHRAASLPAERLAAALKSLFAEAAGTKTGTALERDTAVVLRRIEEAVGTLRPVAPASRRGFLELLGRVTRGEPSSEESSAPRLIVP